MRAFIFSSILLLTGCDEAKVSQPRAGEDAARAQQNTLSLPSSASGSERKGNSPMQTATLVPVDVDDTGIAYPRVMGIAPAAAERINAVLDRRRSEAITGRDDCRRTSEGREINYASRAQERYNQDGLLSFHIVENAFCGGANGTTITGALTFDLATGGEIDVARSIGPDEKIIAQVARRHYAGEPACAAFLRDQPTLTRIDAMFVDRQGLGVVFAFNAGAAESCASSPAIIPAAVIQRSFRPTGPLRRAWSGGVAPAGAPQLGTMSSAILERELGRERGCTLRQGDRILLGAKPRDAVAILDGKLVHLGNAPVSQAGLSEGGTYRSGSTTISVRLVPARGEGDADGQVFNKPADALITRDGTSRRIEAVWTCTSR